MHFAVLVLTRSGSDREVENALAPFDENDPTCQEPHWDWWMVGARFTGLLDGYDPTTDPANLKPCSWCEETGITTEAVAEKYPAYRQNVGKTCRQCGGTKKVTVWPGEQVPHPGDRMPVILINPDRLPCPPFAVIDGDGYWQDGRNFMDILRAFPEKVAVVVDCHD